MLSVINLKKNSSEEKSNSKRDDFCLKKNDRTFFHESENILFFYVGSFFGIKFTEIETNPDLLKDAFGVFSYCIFFKKLKKVLIGTDKLGFSPIYYYHLKELFVFSDFLFEVFDEVGGEVNFEAWDELFNLGDILGDKTTIKNINRLSPGTRISIEAGEVKFETFWTPEVPEFVDPGTYIKKNNDLLFNAMELTKSFEGAKTILLSGGQDSRRIVSAADSIGLDYDLATQEAIHTGGLDDDVLIAEEIADLLKKPLYRGKLQSANEFYEDSFLRDVSLFFESHQHEWILPLARKISRGSLIYDGIVGDVTVNGHYFRKYSHLIDYQSDTDMLANEICPKKSNFRIDKKLLGSSLFERVSAELKKIPDSPHRLTFYYLLNHTRRSISLQSQLCVLHGHQICYPFLYYPFFLQSLSLSPSLLIEKFYQSECIKATNELLDRIPSTRNKVPEKYLIDFSMEQKVRKNFVFSRGKFSAASTAKILPDFKFKLLYLKALGFVSSSSCFPIPWFSESVMRFSSFLTVINDNEARCGEKIATKLQNLNRID